MSKEDIEGFLRQAKHNMEVANGCGYNEKLLLEFIAERVTQEQLNYYRDTLSTKGPRDLKAIRDYILDPPKLEVEPLTTGQEISTNGTNKVAKAKRRGRRPKRPVVEESGTSKDSSQG
jgi:hypothetical protein